MCDFIGFKNNKLNYRSKECNNESYKSINGLIEKFPNVYKFFKDDLNKFALLLKKGVYPYEYMDSWERFDETSLPDKNCFYSEFILGGITNRNYSHAQKVWEVFEINNLGEYQDLYFQCDLLLLADVFEKFRVIYVKIFGLDPFYFLSAPGLA